MSLIARRRSERRLRPAGFGLVEAVVASGLLLMTIVAVTLCVLNVSRAGARQERVMRGERLLYLEAERLRGLPFCASSYPRPAAGEGEEATDLVAAVFPHADPGLNTAAARYLGAGGPGEESGPRFLTVYESDGVTVRCVARFLRDTAGPEVDGSGLDGWDLAQSSCPPAPVLAVELTARPGGRTVRLVRGALTALSPASDGEEDAP